MTDMRISSVQPVKASGLTPEQKQDRALKKACQDFEALLVNQMLTSMRSSVEKSDLFGSREKEDMFQGMLDEEMAKQMSQNDTMGLAEMIYRQFSTANTVKVPAKAVDTLSGQELKDK